VTLDWGDVAALAAIVALGPWGLVLVVALVRGYNLSIRLRRRPAPAARSVDAMTENKRTDPTPDPAVEVPAVVPVVVEADPPATVDRDKLAEAVERAELNPDEGESKGRRP
jgi:hypothetical protein